MTVEQVEVVTRKPTITAARIPDDCTMQDANELEILYGGYIKRYHWSATQDRVFSFIKTDIYSDPPDRSDTGVPGNWIVLVNDHFNERTSVGFISDVEFKSRFKPKGSEWN